MSAISQTTFSNAFSWMEILAFRSKCQWNLFLNALLTIGTYERVLNSFIFMFIHLIVILSILNNIESHNAINNNLWNRHDVESTPIVLAQHRTVSRAYLCHAIASRMPSFAACINQCMFTNDQIMVTDINAIKRGLSRYCPNWNVNYIWYENMNVRMSIYRYTFWCLNIS